MRNFQGIIFIPTRTYREVFRSSLVPLNQTIPVIEFYMGSKHDFYVLIPMVIRISRIATLIFSITVSISLGVT